MLEWAAEWLESRKVPSPRLSIEWLLAHVLGMKRLDLYLHFDRPLGKSELNELRPLLKRRALMEPLQYLTGSTDFFNLTLRVAPGVLIPRPETEELVEHILSEHDGTLPLRFLDAGTGSGAIALSVKKARPLWEVVALDLSQQALDLARENARNNKLDVSFIHTEWDRFRPENPFDIIASNPPYISESEKADIEPQVRDYEPEMALFTDDVPAIYSQLRDLCHRSLKPGGSFCFEINERLAVEILHVFPDDEFKCALRKDYAGKDRMICGKIYHSEYN